MKRLISYIIIILSTGLRVNGQLPYTPESALSPNAASLGEYGNIPVSLYTGRQIISIPLHEINVGGHKLPITLNYNSGGVRPDQHPGWVGMNWVLQAGGCITRVVNSFPDEYYNPKSNYIDSIGGYLYSRDYFDYDFPINTPEDRQNKLLSVAYAGSMHDICPDRFTFNFLDYCGNFYLSPDSGWIVQCDRPIKIEIEYNEDGSLSENNFIEVSELFSLEGTNAETAGRSRCLSKFTIIGEDGTKYIFGDDNSAIEFSIDLYNQIYANITTNCWHLTKIIYPDNREIEFIYERGGFAVQLYQDYYNLSLKSEINEELFGFICEMSGIVPTSQFNGKLILPSYLTNISYDYGHIYLKKEWTKELTYDLVKIGQPYAHEFATNSLNNNAAGMMPILTYNGIYTSQWRDYPSCLAAVNWRQLSEMMIYSTDTLNQNNLVNKINFSYSDTTSQRLTLEAVSIGTHTDNTDNLLTYSFEYKRPDLLPGYLSNQIDHWGYFNGTEALTVTDDNYSESRDPNPAIADIGALTKITYPTGGYTRFEYEPHDYLNKVTEERGGIEVLTSKKYAGGIRIKRIIQSATGDQNDEYIDKEYFYVTDYLTNGINATTSSGTLTQLYKYEFLNKILKGVYFDNARLAIDAYGSQSFLPSLGNVSACHIEYSEVVERNSDGSFSIYKYTCFGDGYVDDPPLATLFNTPSIYEPYSTKDQERGLLRQRIDYNMSGQKTSEVLYYYEKSISNPIVFYQTNRWAQCGVIANEGTAYHVNAYLMRPVKVTTRQYEPGCNFPLSNTITYQYNDHGLPQSVSTTRSDGYSEQTITKYADSFISSGGMYAQMVADNRLSVPVEQSTYIKSGNEMVKTIKRTRYNYTSNPVFPSSIDVAYGNGEFQRQTSYRYDNYYNVLEISQRNAPTKCYIWGYRGTRLLAELHDTPYGFITSVLGSALKYSAADKPDLTRLDYIRNHQTCGMMTTYEYDTRGLISTITYPNGTKRYYYYDFLGRLTMIRDSNGNILETFEYNYAH